MSLKIACVLLEISLNAMSLKIACVPLEISLNERFLKITCVSLGADRIFWSLSGGREGAQSGARQNIQKLQEVNGEADLLGRPFVRTSSTQFLSFQSIFEFSSAWFIQAVCLCLPLDSKGRRNSGECKLVRIFNREKINSCGSKPCFQKVSPGVQHQCYGAVVVQIVAYDTECSYSKPCGVFKL